MQQFSYDKDTNKKRDRPINDKVMEEILYLSGDSLLSHLGTLLQRGKREQHEGGVGERKQ